MTYRHSSLIRKAPAVDVGALVIQMMKNRIHQHDTRSHAEFLADMRSKQAAGKLANPDTTEALLDRLERAT